jgi:transposase
MKNTDKSMSFDAILAENNQLKKLVLALNQANEKLEFELARYKRWFHGAKTEAMNPDQLSLFEETKDEDLAAIEQLQDQADTQLAAAQNTPKKKRPNAVARHPLPEHLKRVEVVHLPTVDGVDDISTSPDWKHIGDDVKEELDIIPAQFFVKKHIFPKFVNRETGEMACALRKPAIIDGGYASSNLLSWVVTSKFLDHLPLYRLEQIAAREGVTLSRSTLADWIGRVGTALAPLFNALQEQLVHTHLLHADETPVDQLDPKTPGKNHKSYLWIYRTGSLQTESSTLVLFDYQTSRAGEHPRAFLKDFTGHLMVDDYAGYKGLFKRVENPVIEVGCWAHARRKFFELYDSTKNTMAKEVIDQITRLYQIETEAKNMSVEERKRIRETKAIPILDELYAYLVHQSHTLSPKSISAKAVNYTLKRWQALTCYANSGDLPIDNNPAENAVRPIALGRKNWLFIGSESAGKRTAVIMSLLATAKANGLNPAHWLSDTLERLPTTLNKNIADLLPLKGWKLANDNL